MTLLGSAVAVGLWLVAGLVGYAVLALIVLFYLPSVQRLRSGPAVDAAFVATLPIVIAMTWLAAVRRHG